LLEFYGISYCFYALQLLVSQEIHAVFYFFWFVSLLVETMDMDLVDDLVDDLEFDRFGVAAGDTSTQVWEVFDCRDPVVFCHRRFFFVHCYLVSQDHIRTAVILGVE